MALSDSRPTRRLCDGGAASSGRDGSPPITRITLPTCRANYPGGSRRVPVSIASPLTRPSPFPRRVGIRNFTFETCSGFTRVTARWIAQPPKAAFVTRLRPGQLPDQAARQLPELSTTLRVESSSTGVTRRRGALGMTGQMPRDSDGLAVGLAVVALVADDGARRHVRPEVEQDREVPAVARLPGGQVEGDRQATEVALEVDLGREAAARAAKSWAVLHRCEPAADAGARAVVESSICPRWAVELVAASASNMASNTPDRVRRQKRFQTAFQSPNSAGRARQVML